MGKYAKTISKGDIWRLDFLGGSMILVTLGTQDKNFDRLLKYIDELLDKGEIKDNVIAQIGHTTYTSKNMETFDFKSTDELNDLRKKADLIITHAGVGSILDSLKLNKKPSAVVSTKGNT